MTVTACERSCLAADGRGDRRGGTRVSPNAGALTNASGGGGAAGGAGSAPGAPAASSGGIAASALASVDGLVAFVNQLIDTGTNDTSEPI